MSDRLRVKLTPPTLDAVDRMKPEELLKYFSYKEKMRTYLSAYDLWDVTIGNVTRPKRPDFERPTQAEIEAALEENDIDLVEQLHNQDRDWMEYKQASHDYDQRAAEAVAVITTSLSKEMTIHFLWNQRSDALDPKALWENIGRWFMEDSAIIISNIQTKLKNIKLEPNERIDELANRIKTHCSHLRALGVEESEVSQKTH